MKTGFAAMWDAPEPRLWSGIPFRLYGALKDLCDTVPVNVGASDIFPNRVMASLYVGWAGGRPRRNFYHSFLYKRLTENRFKEALSGLPAGEYPDRVLEIGDLGPAPVPYYTFQDMHYHAIIESRRNGCYVPYGWTAASDGALRRLAERQLRIYQGAAGIFCMSRWLADSIVGDLGIQPGKVHVAYAGVNLPEVDVSSAVPRKLPAGKARLLFVGVDFYRKGGDILLEAFIKARKEFAGELSLDIVGPEELPSERIPDGAVFHGRLEKGPLAELYRSADVFVMPSRFEPFGISFIEAMCFGLPCIGRKAFAMPEFISENVNGAMAEGLAPREIADKILSVISDPERYACLSEGALLTSGKFRWKSAASVIAGVLGCAAAPGAAAPVKGSM